MKNYQDVVNDRFNQEIDDSNSIYSPNHPIGKYTRKVLFKGLSTFLTTYFDDTRPIDSQKLLDAGCGKGGMIRFFISQGFSPANTVGFDFSQTRIIQAQEQGQGELYLHADVITFKIDAPKFDIITSFDLFSHLQTKEQIIKGLKNMALNLDDKGLFLWYDIYAKDHFTPIKGVDSWGFSREQMIELSKEAGFELVFQKSFFKNYFNRYHSVYQVKRLSAFVVKVLEIVLPGTPGNIMMGFKKRS